MPQVFSKNMNATARGSIVMELIDPKVIQLVTPPPDISGLSLEEQAAPAPWLAIRAHADVRVAVEKCIERNPARARTKSRRNWRWVELTLTWPWLCSSFWSEGRARRGPQSDGRNLLRGREGRGAKVVATLLDLHQASGGPGIEPRWTVQRQRRRGHGLLRIEPRLVHGVEGHPERDLLPDHRSAANPRPAIFDH